MSAPTSAARRGRRPSARPERPGPPGRTGGAPVVPVVKLLEGQGSPSTVGGLTPSVLPPATLTAWPRPPCGGPRRRGRAPTASPVATGAQAAAAHRAGPPGLRRRDHGGLLRDRRAGGQEQDPAPPRADPGRHLGDLPRGPPGQPLAGPQRQRRGPAPRRALNGIGYVVIVRWTPPDGQGPGHLGRASGSALRPRPCSSIQHSRDLDRYRYLLLSRRGVLLVAPLIPHVGATILGARLFVHVGRDPVPADRGRQDPALHLLRLLLRREEGAPVDPHGPGGRPAGPRPPPAVPDPGGLGRRHA